jgi:hypothetical protein
MAAMMANEFVQNSKNRVPEKYGEAANCGGCNSLVSQPFAHLISGGCGPAINDPA